MGRLLKLTANEIEELHAAAGGLIKPCFKEHASLAKRGLIQIKRCRFGEYAVATEAGRTYLSRMESQQVVGPPATRGPGDTGHSNRHPAAASGGTRGIAPPTRTSLLRGAVPRSRRNTAK